MLRELAAAVVLGALLTLQACQPPRFLYLLNNTGATVELLSSASRWQDYTGQVHTESWRRGWLSWPFLIDQGAGRQIKPTPGSLWIFDVRVGRCYVHYEAPVQMLVQEGYQTLQIEPNGLLHFVGAEMPQHSAPRAVDDVAPFADMQPEGFPVEPSSRNCR